MAAAAAASSAERTCQTAAGARCASASTAGGSARHATLFCRFILDGARSRLAPKASHCGAWGFPGRPPARSSCSGSRPRRRCFVQRRGERGEQRTRSSLRGRRTGEGEWTRKKGREGGSSGPGAVEREAQQVRWAAGGGHPGRGGRTAAPPPLSISACSLTAAAAASALLQSLPRGADRCGDSPGREPHDEEGSRWRPTPGREVARAGRVRQFFEFRRPFT